MKRLLLTGDDFDSTIEDEDQRWVELATRRINDLKRACADASGCSVDPD